MAWPGLLLAVAGSGAVGLWGYWLGAARAAARSRRDARELQASARIAAGGECMHWAARSTPSSCSTCTERPRTHAPRPHRDQDALAAERCERKAERAGRTGAEKRLRELQLQLLSGGSGGGGAAAGHMRAAVPTFPFTPIGTVHSVFTHRHEGVGA